MINQRDLTDRESSRTSNGMSVIEARQVTKIFGSGHTAVKAINNVSLDVTPGNIILVMGPSGSGKTTLISMLGTLMRPTKGDIRLDGKNTKQLAPNQLADLRLRTLGFMFQSFNLLSALSALQNVMIPLLAAGVSKPTASKRAGELLAELHLGERLRNLPRDLSGGEKQRVAVARALANEPKVILADEPTANLDSKTGHDVMQLLCQTACSQGRAVVIVSHDTRIRQFAKRVITIEDGKLTNEEKGNHDQNCSMH